MLFVGALTVESLRAGAGDVVGRVVGVPLRQTLLAAMQLLPQGMPLRQFFWPSALLTSSRLSPRSPNNARRMACLRRDRPRHRLVLNTPRAPEPSPSSP